MQHTFYSTCAPGLERAVDAAARGFIRGYASTRLLSGALIYTAREETPAMPCFQNSYLLIAQYARAASAAQAGISLLRDRDALARAARAAQARRFRTIRLMFSEKNALARPDAALRRQLERALPLRVDRANPDAELLILRRSEGMALVLLRLTRASPARKQLPRGALSPALASLMVLLARPRAHGRFLDPFAGHGTLGAARAQLAGFESLQMGDIERTAVEQLARQAPRRAQVLRMDALRLAEYVPDGTISELVTDPPWGEYQALPMPAPAFCAALLARFAAALAPGGMLVVLSAQKEAFAGALARRADLLPLDRFDILVNGKKAAIFVARRASPAPS